MAEKFQTLSDPSTSPIPVESGEVTVPTHGEDVDVSLVVIIGAFSAVGIFLIMVLLQAWFYSESQTERDRKVTPYTDASTTLGQMLAEHNQQLQTYHWIKPETQTRAIPIDRAMELVASEMAATQPRRE